MGTSLEVIFTLIDVKGVGIVTGKPDAIIFPAVYAGCNPKIILEEAVGVVEWKTPESVHSSTSYPQMCFEVFAGAAASKHKAFVGLLTDMSTCGSIFSFYKKGRHSKGAYRKYLHSSDSHTDLLMPVGCAIAQLLKCLLSEQTRLESVAEAGEDTSSDDSNDEESFGDSDDSDQQPRQTGPSFSSAASKLALPAAAAAGGAGSKKKEKKKKADMSVSAAAAVLASPAKPELLMSGQLYITPPKPEAGLLCPPKLEVGCTTVMAPGFVQMFLSELPAHMVEVQPLKPSFDV